MEDPELLEINRLKSAQKLRQSMHGPIKKKTKTRNKNKLNLESFTYQESLLNTHKPAQYALFTPKMVQSSLAFKK
jgi:hypothetical protein